MEGITLIESFITNDIELFCYLKEKVHWDERMSARKTASYGEAYNYSQINYPYQKFTVELEEIVRKIDEVLGFKPNNCLINYYLDGRPKMGFHSDQTDILYEDTGVVIISVGEPRILRFRNIENREVKKDFTLSSGSLFYMTNDVQDKWQHAIPKADTEKARMSLTFRKIKQ
ncbi:alpha-ketoglutarate-dependent dioxygenase AlkB [Tenacibaculum sp. M341]|uniref:alpha-ketoglutarate-dependent dioxygenase AlkB n=1 Tax=Tenacibaculum sp. M341 TaxID=2530339 RepID=UPI0010489137|nr:alpha-ketoglutarate-dependent dioxygenase AlkB [Tenacibaculum sp. M341]TCI85453.1 alpha-ketoglutarate-dependent dioxygenase AlkB [Tenacibaculum sp. M341]